MVYEVFDVELDESMRSPVVGAVEGINGENDMDDLAEIEAQIQVVEREAALAPKEASGKESRNIHYLALEDR